MQKDNSPNRWLALLSVTIFAGLIHCNHSAYALPQDKDKPILLSADTADISQTDHVGIYTGHVDFKQGTSHILASRAKTEVDSNNKLSKAIAYGTNKLRAHFSTKTDKTKPTMHAKALVISYYPQKHLIVLEGNAEVTQGSNRFTADIIRYDTEKQHVISNSSGEARTTIIINSDKIR